MPTADDFDFAVGNNDNVGSWADAPDPTYVNAYPGRGPADRPRSPSFGTITQSRTNGCKSQCSPHQVTGLSHDDVFYFGNAIGADRRQQHERPGYFDGCGPRRRERNQPRDSNEPLRHQPGRGR